MVSGFAVAPRVFISYAHASVDHAELVRDLWVFLRAHGVDARLDVLAAQRRRDWPLWMADQVREADFVLVIASEEYRERAEGRAGPGEGRGVQWEARLIRDAFYGEQSRLDRFVPVVLPGETAEGVPDFLAPASCTVYRVSEFNVAGAQALLRLLLGQPGEVEPPLGEAPSLPPRAHATPAMDRPVFRHELAVEVELLDDGRVRTRVVLAGTELGSRCAVLPAGLAGCWEGLGSSSGEARLAGFGARLWDVLFDEATGRRLVELIDQSPLGTVVDVVVSLPDELAGLPFELLAVPGGRALATVPGVRLSRRLAGVQRVATPPLAGPLKILAAVAAPEETRTENVPLDVEAEMQVLLDAVSALDLDGGSDAQVRILEVASLAEIQTALKDDQYHVLHLSAHGSACGVELEDEDGNPQLVSADDLVTALRAGGHPLPLVVLSSCAGASGGAQGLAATLIRRGADRVVAMQAAVTDGFATALAGVFYRELAGDVGCTVAQALAVARHTVAEQVRAAARAAGRTARPEYAIPTLLAAGDDPPLRTSTVEEVPLRRPTVAPSGGGVRELPLGELIGRRAALRITSAVLRSGARDRERFGDWAGVALTGIGGIGKTALAGRVLARARENGWLVAEHIGSWNPPALFAVVADALTDPTFVQARAQLRASGVDETAKLRLVVSVLAQVRLVVLFDDFEQNLTPDARGFSDPGFAEIFAVLCDAATAGRVLVTCRYPVPGSEDTLLRVELPGLSIAELRRLFLRLPALRELSEDDRRLVVRTIGGHPRLIEFLDVLLREGTGSRFRHVTRKLRALATAEGLDPKQPRQLTDGVSEAVRLGSRDILLDALVEDLSEAQQELVLQAALSRAPLAIEDLAHTRHGSDSTPEQTRVVRADAERLVDLTLLTREPDSQLAVHPWVAAALEARHTDDAREARHTDDTRKARHQRGAEMRLSRLNNGRGGFDDLVELIRHLAGCDRYDDAVAVAFQSCDIVDGPVAVSALLADTVPLIPTTHPQFLALADRECAALLASGLASATAHRYQQLLRITQDRAQTDPGNAGYQRDLSVSHNKLGEVAVATGDTTAAAEHYQASLVIRERLAAADPGNAGYQRDLSVSHNRLGEVAVATGDTTAAAEHYQAGLVIAQGLAAADPGNAGYQRDLSISHERLAGLSELPGEEPTDAE